MSLIASLLNSQPMLMALEGSPIDEPTIKADMDSLLALARQYCSDPDLAASIDYSLEITGQLKTVAFEPDIALPELSRAHRELRGSLHDESNDLLDACWEKFSL